MLNQLFANVAELVNGKNIFITGGTGTFGHTITDILLNNYLSGFHRFFQRQQQHLLLHLAMI